LFFPVWVCVAHIICIITLLCSCMCFYLFIKNMSIKYIIFSYYIIYLIFPYVLCILFFRAYIIFIRPSKYIQIKNFIASFNSLKVTCYFLLENLTAIKVIFLGKFFYEYCLHSIYLLTWFKLWLCDIFFFLFAHNLTYPHITQYFLHHVLIFLFGVLVLDFILFIIQFHSYTMLKLSLTLCNVLKFC